MNDIKQTNIKGYVVYKGVANDQEVEKGIDLFWHHMNFMSEKRVKRKDNSV